MTWVPPVVLILAAALGLVWLLGAFVFYCWVLDTGGRKPGGLWIACWPFLALFMLVVMLLGKKPRP